MKIKERNRPKYIRMKTLNHPKWVGGMTKTIHSQTMGLELDTHHRHCRRPKEIFP